MSPLASKDLSHSRLPATRIGATNGHWVLLSQRVPIPGVNDQGARQVLGGWFARGGGLMFIHCPLPDE